MFLSIVYIPIWYGIYKYILVPSKIYPGYPGDIPDIFFDFFIKIFLKIYPGSKLVNALKKFDGLYLLSFHKN